MAVWWLSGSVLSRCFLASLGVILRNLFVLAYRRLWLFSACAYELRLQETMRLTDNVRLTSGIIVATPSMRKHVIAKRSINRERWTNEKNGDDKRPSVRRLYFSSPYFQRDMDSKNRGDCTSSTRSRNPHDRNAVALLKVDGTVVGHVPSSFLLGSLALGSWDQV